MRIRDFLYLNKSDRHVLLTLLVVAGFFMGACLWLDRMSESDFEADGELTDSIPSEKGKPAPIFVGEVPQRQVERFAFDPNTADSTALLRLGLQSWQVRNIIKYRAAGGIFRRKEDFAQVYGLTQKEYRELEPFIRISSDYQPAALLVKDEPLPRDTALFPRKIQEGEVIDLAVADTAQLKRVPGIGSYYARQIAAYGRRLGGYVSVDQLDEIQHFPKDAKRFFTIGTASPHLLNLNRLSVGELKQHPYLNYYQARAIVEHRRKNGPLKSIDDLRLLPDFPPEELQRLAPYVEF